MFDKYIIKMKNYRSQSLGVEQRNIFCVHSIKRKLFHLEKIQRGALFNIEKITLLREVWGEASLVKIEW